MSPRLAGNERQSQKMDIVIVLIRGKLETRREGLVSDPCRKHRSETKLRNSPQAARCVYRCPAIRIDATKIDFSLCNRS